jgi:hypothetical protein
LKELKKSTKDKDHYKEQSQIVVNAQNKEYEKANDVY